MRIAISTAMARRVGGVETYLSNIMPVLAQLGHELALWHEKEGPRDRDFMLGADLASVPRWSVEALGAQRALAEMVRWKPDVIYAHGLEDPNLEAALLEFAPNVFFIHNYHGTCISGAKTFKHPTPRPCSRSFGPACLLHYYPRRCGGRSPITMISEYRRQRRRLGVLKRYDAIVTHSHHMYAEYAKNGISPDRLHRFVYYSPEQPVQPLVPRRSPSGTIALPVAQSSPQRLHLDDCLEVRLTFVGRMDTLKGGGLLIEALPTMAQQLGRPIQVTFAGDGPARQSWEQEAKRLVSSRNDIQIDFVGWLAKPQVQELISRTHLIVFPSVWPEPFGLVGPEAGRNGVPVAAFAVGGVRDWLIDGVNGFLAPGDPPTAGGLAHAAIECLRDSATHDRLSRGAFEMAERFNRESHLAELLRVFAMVTKSIRTAPTGDLIAANS